jgi:hypothetical protein
MVLPYFHAVILDLHSRTLSVGIAARAARGGGAEMDGLAQG